MIEFKGNSKTIDGFSDKCRECSKQKRKTRFVPIKHLTLLTMSQKELDGYRKRAQESRYGRQENNT